MEITAVQIKSKLWKHFNLNVAKVWDIQTYVDFVWAEDLHIIILMNIARCLKEYICYVQSSDRDNPQIVPHKPGIRAYMCGTCTLIETWRIITVKQQTKIPFLSRKRNRSKFLTQESVCIIFMYKNPLLTDCIRLLSAIFDWVSQHLSSAQKHSIINNSWLWCIIFTK